MKLDRSGVGRADGGDGDGGAARRGVVDALEGDIVSAAVCFPITPPLPENVFPFPTVNPAAMAETLNDATLAMSTDEVLAIDPLVPSASVPEEMVVAPLKVLLPLSVRVPVPA